MQISSRSTPTVYNIAQMFPIKALENHKALRFPYYQHKTVWSRI